MARFPRPLAVVLLAAVSGILPGAAPLLCAQPVTSRNIQLEGHFDDSPPPSGSYGYSACWAYVHSDGREYAAIGAYNGTWIYQISTPPAAHSVGFIPGPISNWREMKAYRDWLYVVTEGLGAGQGLQIIRMTDPEHPALAATYATQFVRSHTISVDTARALLYCNGTHDALGRSSGMRILSLAQPEAPSQLSWWPGGTLPVAPDRYVHDAEPLGDRLYASSIYGQRERLLDVSDPAQPSEIFSWTYPGSYTHSCWRDSTTRWLYVTDEISGEPLKIFDIGNPCAPVLAG